MLGLVVVFLIVVVFVVFCLVAVKEDTSADSSPPSVSPPPGRPSQDPVDPPAPAESTHQPAHHRGSQVRVQLDAGGSAHATDQTAVAVPPPSGVRGEDRDLEMILGIRAGMSEGEIRRILLAEYRRWNSRVTHPDPEIRKRAEERLRLIGGLRQQLLG